MVIGTDVFCPKARELSSWCRVHLERQVLINTGYALQLLVSAFSKLKNLRMVGLHDQKMKRSQRVGEDETRRGYGWSLPGTRSRTNGLLVTSLRCHRLHHKSPDPIFPLILHALSVAGARPRSIVVHPLEDLSATCLSIMSGPLARSILPVISRLRTLHLSLQDQQGSLSAHRAADDYLYGLQVLLQHTPLLERLRLDFDLHDSMMPRKFESWPSLYQNPTIEFLEIAQLRFLATLELGMLTLFPQTLLNVVSKFPTLTSLCFRKITLEDGSAATRVRSMWSDFLLELADCVERQGAMTSLSIRDPAYKHLHCFFSIPVYFATHDSPKGSKVEQTGDYTTQASYYKCSGSDVRVWLQKLATGIYHADSEEDETDIYVLSDGGSLSDQSTQEGQSDESFLGDWSTEDGGIATAMAATMYEQLSGANNF